MKVLLHICCAVCASACVERLRAEGQEVYGYFYNPNIQPKQEYQRRLEHLRRLAEKQKFSLIEDDYAVEEWFSRTQGLENEPEGGQRCRLCFRLRLAKAKEVAEREGFASFTTTLTISPHKDAQAINAIGRELAGRQFLMRDFKKQNGFQRAQQLAKQFNLYHQNYCGCIYSK